ncbi:MAG: DUF4147 domain-containing protein [Sedimentitalea sp.]
MSDALTLWQAGVAAVDGHTATQSALPGAQKPDQIIAVGKAAAAMARAAMAQFPDTPTLVVTKDGHGDDLPPNVTLIEAAHPVPNDKSVIAGKALRETVAGLANTAHLLLLVSGGASSLAEDPVPGKTLDDLKTLNARLLAEGLDITAMNAQRRKISQIKGGGLLGHFTGKSVQVLAISDVPGDDLGVIGSGIGAAPPSHDFDFDATIVASNTVARDAAEARARALGLHVHANRESLHAALPDLVKQIGAELRAMAPGVLVLGGEPTVILPPNPGEGGRNQALALELAREIQGIDGLSVVVGGTDGSDGPTGAAGGIVTAVTWQPQGQAALDTADSGPFLAARNARLTTGPTGTNVMDLLIAHRTDPA